MTLDEWRRIAEKATPKCTEQNCPYLGSNRVYGCQCAREMDRALARLAEPTLHQAAIKVIEAARAMREQVFNGKVTLKSIDAFSAALAELEALP